MFEWWRLMKTNLNFRCATFDFLSAADPHRHLWPISGWTWPRFPSGFCRCRCAQPHSRQWCSSWSSRRTGRQWPWPHCQGSGSPHCTSTQRGTMCYISSCVWQNWGDIDSRWFVGSLKLTFIMSHESFSVVFTLTSPTLGKVSMVITVSSPVWFCSCPFRIRADVYVVSPIPEAQNTKYQNLRYKQRRFSLF